MWVSGLLLSSRGLSCPLLGGEPGSADPHTTLHRFISKACVLTSTQGILLGRQCFSKPFCSFLCPSSNIWHLYPETHGTQTVLAVLWGKGCPWLYVRFLGVFPGSEVLQRKEKGMGQIWILQLNMEPIEAWVCSLPGGQKPLEEVGVERSRSEPRWAGPERGMLLPGPGSLGLQPCLNTRHQCLIVGMNVPVERCQKAHFSAVICI